MFWTLVRKPVPGFPGYRVDPFGGVWSNRSRNGRGAPPRYPRRLRPGINSGGYPSVRITLDGRVVSYLVHRLIVLAFRGEIPYGLTVDHVNRVRTDNRLGNLRLATQRQQTFNASIRPGSSRFIGVHRACGRWRACVMADGQKHYAGYFEDEADAARARDAAARKYHGEFAALNFPADEKLIERANRKREATR